MSKDKKEKIVQAVNPFDSEDLEFTYGDELDKIEVFPTGSLGLDILLNGGYHPGFVQLWGPNAIGKTTIALNMAAEYMKFHNYQNVRCVYHAVEGRWNSRLLLMAKGLLRSSPTETFINPKTKKEEPLPIFLVNRPESGEQMYEGIVRRLQQEKIKYFHIVDCVDNIKTEANAGKTMSDAEKTASIASLNTRFGREASNVGNNYGHVIVLIHQIRDKIATGWGQVSQVGKHRSGGHMVEHIANMRLLFEKPYKDFYIKEDENDKNSHVIGHNIKVTLDKVSTSGKSHRDVSIPFIYDLGVDSVREIAGLSNLCTEIITKDKNTFLYKGEKIGIGENQYLKYLKNHPEVVDELRAEIKRLAGI